jgi:chorismate mutase
MATGKAATLLGMLTGLRSAALTARGEVARIDKQLAELRDRRMKVATAPPHVDDLVAFAARNVDRYRDRYLARAVRYLSAEQLASRGNWDGVPSHIQECGFALFRLEHNLGMPADMLSLPHESDAIIANHTGLPPDLLALIGLLADPIKAGLRDMILRVNPGSADGMPLKQRSSELAKIDADIAALVEEREEVLAAVREAGDAVNGEAA